MKPEEKELLLTDLCARLPYGVICQGICEIWDNDEEYYTYEFHKTIIVDGKLQGIQFDSASIDGNICNVETVKPYLRPISSMPEEEFEYLNKLGVENSLKCIEIDDPMESFSLATMFCVEQLAYLYKRHYDVFGLIPDGLAKSTEEYNPYKD